MVTGSHTRATQPIAVSHEDSLSLPITSRTRPATASSAPRVVTAAGAVASIAFHQRYHMDMSVRLPGALVPKLMARPCGQGTARVDQVSNWIMVYADAGTEQLPPPEPLAHAVTRPSPACSTKVQQPDRRRPYL